MRITLDITPGLFGDDTPYATAGRWMDASNVRFWRGRPQVIGGWESIFGELLTGTCRTVFQWTDNAAAQNIAFGTHSALQVWQSGVLATITPYRRSTRLTDPFTVSDGSTTVMVADEGHGLTTGTQVTFMGADTVGRVDINNTYPITVVDADTYSVMAGGPADLAKTLGPNPLSVINGSPLVTVTDTGHGLSEGTSITISGASALGGVTPNGTFPITVIDANSYSYTFTSNASSTTGGGGAAVIVAVPTTGGGSCHAIYHVSLAAGSVDGTGGAGYGTGAYSTGAYSEPSTGDYFPRTWSLAAWGEELLASPRGGTLYRWRNDTAAIAAEVVEAPDKITHMLVAPQDMVFALGCNEEASGDFNPLCIRHSGVRQLDVWTTSSATTAREYVLPGGGRIVAGRVIGPYILVWTTHALFLGTFVGSLQQPWKFDRVGLNCGLIGPNAAAVVGQQAFWLGPDLQFRHYSLGGAPDILSCPIQDDMADNLTPSQGDKVVASSVSAFNEIRFDYPDARDGFENSRYITLALADGAWSRGLMSRTAFVDAGPSQNPIGVDGASRVYWHERGRSADGGAFPWFIESADQYIDENSTLMVRAFWPDIADQEGAVAVSLKSRLSPQAEERRVGPFGMAPGQEKVDLRLSGRLFRVRFEGATAPTAARLGKPIVEVTTTGQR